MKVKNIKIFSAILLVFIFNLIAPNMKVNASKNDDKYDLTISYGIDGKYKAQKYMPVTVQINNLEKDFNGEIELRIVSDYAGGYNSYSKEVYAKVGESVSVTIPVKFLDGNNSGTLCLVENDKVLYEKKFHVSSGRVSEGNALTGLLTDDATALGYLGDITYFDSSYSNVGRMNCVNIDESYLSENGLNIDVLDLIVINNYNMANLNEDHYSSLNNWVNEGGTLIIGTGANESKTITNINKNFLNISSEGTIERNVAITNENLNLILSQITLEGATVTNNSYGNKLVYSLDRGAGTILVTTFDLGLEPFISSSDATLMLQNMLIETFDKIYQQDYNGSYNSSSYQASYMLRNIPVQDVVSPVTLGIILATYAVLVGIVLYVVLKKMKRNELTWILIPITAVIFTILIYLLGSKMKFKDVVVNSVNIISTDENGKGQINGYIGIGSKNKGNLKIEKEENLNMKYISDDYYYYGDTSSETKTLKIKTTYIKDNSYFTVANNVSEMNKFEVSGKEIVLPKIENSLKIKDGSLEGTIKNNLDYDIKKLIIVSGQSVWDLGEVSTGEQISISEAEIKNSYGIQGYADSIQNEYYNAQWDDSVDKRDPKFKNVERYSSLLYLLSNGNYIGAKTKIIAITDLPVDYSLKIENKSISNYDLTAVVQDADIDFKDEDGNLNFPEGYFEYSIASIADTANFDYYEGYIYGYGDVILEYDIDTNVDVKEITINSGTDRWGYQYGVDGEYYIYNYNTNEYEKFSLSSGSYKISNDGSYTLNNKIQIKIVASNDGNNAAPKLMIKGVEK